MQSLITLYKDEASAAEIISKISKQNVAPSGIAPRRNYITKRLLPRLLHIVTSRDADSGLKHLVKKPHQRVSRH